MPEQGLWVEFGEATRDDKDGRSGVLRDFISWYLHKPGAALPDRPDAQSSTG